MSRPSFRARPIDISQALAIVRDESVLNDESQAVAREVTHAHKNLDKDNEEVRRRRPFPRAPPLPFSHGVRPGTRQRCPGRGFLPSPLARIWPGRRARDPIFPVFPAPPDTSRIDRARRIARGAIGAGCPRRRVRFRGGSALAHANCRANNTRDRGFPARRNCAIRQTTHPYGGRSAGRFLT